MKIKIQLAAVALAALALAAPAAAQESRPKFGLGVAIFPISPGFGGTFEVYSPFQVEPNFRV